MENTISSKIRLPFIGTVKKWGSEVTNLANAQIDTEYIIKEVRTDDEELGHFLFTLGCYEGETVTVISVLSENYVISVKDARYSIDKDLAEAIIV